MKKRLPFTLLLTFITFAAFGQLYWITGTTIAKADADGGNVNLSFINVGSTITDIFVDEANSFIYWVDADNGLIGKGDFGGTIVNSSFVTTGADPNYMTIDLFSGWIYYTHDNGNIGRADLATGNTTVNNSFMTGALSPQGIVTFGNFIYWANSADGTIGFGLNSGLVATQAFISGGSGITDLDISANGKLFWLNTGTNTIGSDFSTKN